MSFTPASHLFLLRHAHASSAVPGQRDHQRPLDERGRREAAAIGAALRSLDRAVDLVVCSSATRARETLDGVRPFLAGASGGRPGERMSDDLYALGPDAYLAAARHAGATTVLLVGHNPTIEAFAGSIVGSGNAGVLKAMKRGFPTAGLALVAFATPLAAIEHGAGRLEAFLGPRAP